MLDVSPDFLPTAVSDYGGGTFKRLIVLRVAVGSSSFRQGRSEGYQGLPEGQEHQRARRIQQCRWRACFQRYVVQGFFERCDRSKQTESEMLIKMLCFCHRSFGELLDLWRRDHLARSIRTE
jgi:hypothetical protein